MKQKPITERKVSQLNHAEVKLKRALQSGLRHDPISGFTLADIKQYLSETPMGQVVLRRNGC
jgi:hypothetical protein